MRKRGLVALATVMLVGVPIFASTAYGDTTPPGQSQDVTAETPAVLGPQSDVVRPGADPNNPYDYAYLPENDQPPVAGPRTEQPQAPPPLTPASTTAGSTTTNTTGSTTSSTTSSNTVGTNNVTGTNGNETDSEKDANGTLDLALGKPYTIGTQWPDQLFHASEATNFPDTGQLTDGSTASLSFSDKGWVGFLRQYGRSVVVNLGSVDNVRRVSLDFLQNLGAGISFPDSVTYYGSTDGTNWYRIGTAWSTQGAGDYTPQSQAFTYEADVNAQYIRAQFTDKVFAFADELSVFGATTQDANRPRLEGHSRDLTQIIGDNYLIDPRAPGVPGLGGDQSGFGDNQSGGFGDQQSVWPPTPAGYLRSTDPATGHIGNMQLVYTGAYGAQGTWSSSDFGPMIAQEDASGNPTGWLFDATLFLPYGNLATTSTAWTGWLTDLYSPNIELSALDQEVGTLKQKLNDPSFKEKVVITIPTLWSSPSNFGAIDPSGQNLDMNPADVGQQTANDNKVRAIEWYIQQVMSQWNKANYQNLQFEGFYWEPESVNAAEPLDVQLIQRTSQLVHEADSKFYWIPYYGAPGLVNWQQLGFDAVMVQPTVSFNWSINAAARLQSVAQMDEYYHMGVELEAHWDVTSTNTALAQTAQNRYFDYLTGGNVYGYEGNVMHSYYMNSKSLLIAYQNTNPFYHQVYDDTVKFVDGQWTNTTFQ